MLKIGVKHNLDKVAKQVSKMGNDQVPFATSLALNRVGQLARQSLLSTMKREFDRPTPFMLNSLYTRNSTKRNLSIVIGHRPGRGGKLDASRSLRPEIEGGPRSQKATEKFFGYYLLPSKYLALDAYGNIPAAMLKQIRTQLAIGPRNASQARAQARKERSKSFRDWQVFYPGDGSGKAPGIWIRRGNGALVPMLFFSSTPPKYQARYDIEGVVQRTYEAEFGRQFAAAMDYALSTAKIKL